MALSVSRLLARKEKATCWRRHFTVRCRRLAATLHCEVSPPQSQLFMAQLPHSVKCLDAFCWMSDQGLFALELKEIDRTFVNTKRWSSSVLFICSNGWGKGESVSTIRNVTCGGLVRSSRQTPQGLHFLVGIDHTITVVGWLFFVGAVLKLLISLQCWKVDPSRRWDYL